MSINPNIVIYDKFKFACLICNNQIINHDILIVSTYVRSLELIEIKR